MRCIKECALVLTVVLSAATGEAATLKGAVCQTQNKAASLQFKGITIGAPLERVTREAMANDIDIQLASATDKKDKDGGLVEKEVHLRGIKTRLIQLSGRMVEVSDMSFAGIDDIVVPAIFSNLDGKLFLKNVTVLFGPSDDEFQRFEKIRNALSLKYGRPSEPSLSVCCWHVGTGMIVLTATPPAMSMTDEALEEKLERASARKDSSDL